MERRTLTDPRALAVRSSAIATYLGLVGSVQGAVVTRPKGMTLVQGPPYFSFCNFAAGFDLPEPEVEPAIALIKERAERSSGFYAFCMTGDKPEDIVDRLCARGFERRQELVAMWSQSPTNVPQANADLVKDADDRREVAQFMARQFFSRMPKEARTAIAAATASGPHTMWRVGPVSDPRAAVMLVEQPESVGLFNLCVRQDLRGARIGSGLVSAVLASAHSIGRPVVLQCDPGLAAWYRTLGFEAVGTVEALALSSGTASDII